MAIESLLGKKVKDKISGFKGVVVGETRWLWGCLRVGVERRKVNNDGKVSDPEWFDVDRVEVIAGSKTMRIVSTKAETAVVGGPESDPSRSSRSVDSGR